MRISVRYLVVIAALLAALPAVSAGQAGRKDDVVHLKDGRVLRGKIIEFFPNDSTFLMRLPDGTFERHNKADIAYMNQATAAKPGEEHHTLKSPPVAWGLSFLITGVGQIYNEDVVTGIGLFVIGGVGTLMYLSGASEECFGAECDTKKTVGAVIAVAAWLTSQIEAPIKASAINREVRGRRASLNLRPEPHAMGVSLVSVRF